MALGESLGMTDLAPCTSVGECLETVHRAAAAARGVAGGGRVWLRMKGARIEGWNDARWPTLAELDAAAGDLPCVIMGIDHHAAAANSAAMAAARLRAGMTVPPSGIVCTDREGRATGLLMEHAAYRAWYAAPQPTPAQREDLARAALSHLASLGYVEVHDMQSEEWLGPLLAGLRDRGELRLSVWLYAPIARVREAAAGKGAWESREVRLAGGKVFADGTVNSVTALMLEDYADAPTDYPRGRAMVTPEQLDAAFATCAELNLGVAVHAIGDGAVRMVLDRWERRSARGAAKPPPGVPALRIEHCQLIDASDVPRFARLGVVCSMQPCHLLSDIEAMRRHFPHRLHRVMPLRELIESGCRPGKGGLLWFGSDVPIVRADPEDSIIAATQRRRPGMSEHEAIALEQRIEEEQAWAGLGSAESHESGVQPQPAKKAMR
jgi:hypothetical protein